MVTLVMTSDNMDGEVIFTYNHKNLLENLNITGVLTPAQYRYLAVNMPVSADDIAAFVKKTAGARFVVAPIKVTFDMMWDLYNDKVRSSKTKSLKKWNRMTTDNQVRAYLYFPTYDRNRGSAEKKYLETYLNAEQWNN